MFLSEEKYFGALLLFHKTRIPSSSDASTHVHIETPSCKIYIAKWSENITKLGSCCALPLQKLLSIGGASE